MSYETNDKMVSHPDHYKSGKYEVIDIIDEFTKDLSGTEAVCTANAIKYILRWKKKNGVQDLKKAIWYLTHLIETFTNEGLGEPQGRYTIKQDVVNKTCGNCKHFEFEMGGAYCSGFCTNSSCEKSSGTPSNPACGLWEKYDISELAPDKKSSDDVESPHINKCINCKYFNFEEDGNPIFNAGFGLCTYYSTVIHNQKEACKSFEDRDKPSIDDEPEPLKLRKNAAGVYIPQENEKED